VITSGLQRLGGGQVARSISKWYADHAQGLPDDLTDDEVVETQALWDLQSSQLSTTRSVRRDARLGGGGARTTRAQSSGGRTRPTSAGGRSAAPPPARGTAGSVPKSVRKKVLAAVQLNPRADVNALAASLTRAGIPVTPQQVAAVLGRSFRELLLLVLERPRGRSRRRSLQQSGGRRTLTDPSAIGDSRRCCEPKASPSVRRKSPK
jgi:hypothetical protein